MLDSTKRTLSTLTAAAFLGVGGWAIAGSSNPTNSTTQSTAGTTTQSAAGSGQGGMRHAHTPVSDAELAKIKAAVTAKYAGATVNHAMKDADGSFDAMVTKSDGTRVGVELSSSFAITGEMAGRGKGMRGGMMGTAASAAELAKIKAAVTAKYAGATVDRAIKKSDGTFHAHVAKSDGSHVHVALSSSFAITGEMAGRGPGMRGGMMGTAASAAELAKIKAAVTAKIAGATVDRAMKKSDGTFHAHATKSDGTHVHVTLSSSFAVTAVDEKGPGGPPMP